MLSFLEITVLCALAVAAWLFVGRRAASAPSIANPTPTPMPKSPAAVRIEAPRAASSDAKTRCVIIFATIAGSTERLAHELSKRIKSHAVFAAALNVAVINAEHYEADEFLAEDGIVIFLAATYTEGSAPPSAARVFEWLTWEADSPRSGSAMRRAHFAVFGLGNSVYGKYFNAAGRTVDRCFYQLGAARLVQRGIGDESRDLLAQFDHWCDSLFAKMTPLFASGARPVAHASAVAQTPAAAAAAADSCGDDCGSGGDGGGTNAGGDDDNASGEPMVDMEDMGGALDGEVDAETTAELLRIPNEQRREMLTNMQRRTLSKQGYQLLGSHSAVKMCRWTKAQLRGRGGCYKHTFYGIVSYLCMETTPSLACANKCVFCVAEGTLVSVAAGVALPVEQLAALADAGDLVLALNEDGSGLTAQRVTAFTDSGTKQCVELLFADGRTLVCTPDHRIRAAPTAEQPARWIEAGKLAIGELVEIGPEFVASSLVVDHHGDWRVDLRDTLGYELSVATAADALLACAFARVCGRLMSASVVFDNRLDVDAFVADVLRLTSETPSVLHDSTAFSVEVPDVLLRAVHSVGVSTLTHAATPDNVVREFLGGLFGGVTCDDGDLDDENVAVALARFGEKSVGYRFCSRKSRSADATAALYQKGALKRSASCGGDDRALPTARAALTARRDVGAKRVFDITVPLPASREGSFVANGVVVHNCWRHHKNPVGRDFVWKMDPPEMLVDEAVKKHVGMIKQLRGVPGVVPERLVEAMTPRHCALSLVGEPIVYPEINRFCDLLHERGISSFLVTNAQFPEQMETLKPITQLYISCDAASKDELKAVDRPIFEDFWERFLTSIDALSRKQQRTVFRLTLVDQMNMTDVSGYAALIRRGHPDLIEVKGVTYCGSGNTNPLTMANVPWHHQVVEFSQRLAAAIGDADGLDYGVASEHEHSNCVLLARRDKFFRNGKWWTWIDFERFLELVKSGKPFTSTDYMVETPDWAQFGAVERGFDPAETRFRRNQVNVEPVATGDGGC